MKRGGSEERREEETEGGVKAGPLVEAGLVKAPSRSRLGE